MLLLARRPLTLSLVLSLTLLLVVVAGGCSAYTADYQPNDEYYLLYDGVYYPAEDGLPDDADVRRYTHTDRYTHHRLPSVWDAQPPCLPGHRRR